MKPTRKHSDLALYLRLLSEARPFWRQIAALLLLSLLSTPITLLNPLPLKLIVDSFLGPHDLPQWLNWLLAGAEKTSWRTLASLAGMLIVFVLTKQLLELAFGVLRSYTGEKLVLSFRSKLFRHSQSLSLSYHDAAGSADSTYRIQYDAPAIQWITIDAFIPLLSSGLTLTAMMWVIAQIDITLALVALAVAPVLFFLSQFYSHRLKVRWQEAKELESSTFSVVQEVLSSVRIVKAFSAEDREQGRYVRHASRSLCEQIKLAVTSGSFNLIVGLAIATGTATVLFLGAQHVQTGKLTLGELILVMSYLGLLYTPLQTVSKSAASLQGSLVSAERAFALLDTAPEVREAPTARPLGRAQGAVTLENVSFSYTGGRTALSNVSFEISAGSRVGIAGATGAGKSTLVSLLLRLYDPTRGTIFLDGADIRDFKLRDLRNQFAIVLQEPVLFASSIAENIAYAKPEASEDEIIAAARAANAHEFIVRLPRGYSTDVGERGIQLSGGERQRISLARAFLKDSALLILDEPTSSVDTKTEGLILEAMERLMKGRTTFMIAHRLSTLDICDVRLELEQGRLVSLRRATSPLAGPLGVSTRV